MGGFLLRRFAAFIPVLILSSVLVFSLIYVAPGDPVDVIIGADRADPATIANIRRQMGLDKPAPVQYFIWASHVVRGDLGYSYRSREPVSRIVLSRLPLTVELTLLSILFGLAVAIPLGIGAALNRNHWVDAIASVFAALGASMPAFWLGILLIYLFTLRLHWLPPSGYVRFTQNPLENLRFMILPMITLGVGYAAVITRFLRSSILDIIALDFVRTARAKGIAERAVIFRHIVRNALIPLVTIIGLETGRLLGGAILTETIFALPGMGRLAVDAILSRDFPTMQAAVLFMAVAVLGANLVVDLLYGALDPRIGVG